MCAGPGPRCDGASLQSTIVVRTAIAVLDRGFLMLRMKAGIDLLSHLTSAGFTFAFAGLTSQVKTESAAIHENERGIGARPGNVRCGPAGTNATDRRRDDLIANGRNWHAAGNLGSVGNLPGAAIR